MEHCVIIAKPLWAFETQIWKGGTYFYDVYALNRTAAWNGTFDLKVVFNPGNLSYPNILTVSNYFHSTFNNYNISPAVDLRDEQSNFKASIPENTNESVSPMPNAFLKIFFDSQMLYEYDAPWFLDGLIYINDGVIFLSNGSIPPSNNRCYTKIIEGRVHGLNGTLRFCFNDLENTVIENDNEGKCREFETIAAISSIVNGNISQSIIFTVQYILLEDKINVTLDVRSSSPPDFKKLIINGEHDSYGWCDDDGSSFSSCKLELNVPEFDNFQYEFIFACTGWEDITVGELIKRNGVFVRDINIPFTSANPCWTKKGEIHIFDTNLYNASFCCKTFDNDIPITTPTATSSSIFSTKLMTLTTGTTSLPSTNSPTTNSYGTLCSTNTSQAWLDIIFIVDIAFSMSTKNLQQMSGEIATVLQSFTFNQNGEHTTRAGIIIYGSEFATLYELNNVTNFVGFEKVFLSLFKYYDPYDYDSNVYSALDAAYRLLQIQNSHRIPLIVLISATYNPSGFKGTSELSRNIKGNGTNIVVINFDPENPNLTNALQAIVSSGYYYVSTQQDLYINLGYAFTQLKAVFRGREFGIYVPRN
uniref:VWFA domain-containing protein n=1 Tax=Panagrolaimus superbus TaxID=310955 RepID=A0A914YD97_9BILA